MNSGVASSRAVVSCGNAPPEMRSVRRKRVLKAGKIVFQSRYCTVECAIRDISACGARITTQHSVSIPDKFTLVIEIDGIEVDCHVVWRKERQFGVRFVGEPRSSELCRKQVLQANIPSQKKLRLKRSVEQE